MTDREIRDLPAEDASQPAPDVRELLIAARDRIESIWHDWHDEADGELYEQLQEAVSVMQEADPFRPIPDTRATVGGFAVEVGASEYPVIWAHVELASGKRLEVNVVLPDEEVHSLRVSAVLDEGDRELFDHDLTYLLDEEATSNGD